MKKLLMCLVALMGLVRPPVQSQAVPSGLADTWQGTLQANGRSIRLVYKIAKATDANTLKTTLYNIDQPGGQGLTADQTTLQGSAVTIASNAFGFAYEGKLAPDGNTVAGTWTQGGAAFPLTIVRATRETAWAIPDAPAPPRMMAADANPSFEVATIKPNNSGATGMQGLTLAGRNFQTRASSLGDLIAFAYQVQAKQIIGVPDWANTDRYDIAAVPDKEGAPNADQVRLMIQKLLADRFQLTFHHDKRELSAFVLAPGKTGSKLNPTQIKGPLPGIGMSPGKGGVSLNVVNATIGDLTGFLQSLVLDRPVVDQTGLTGRYDFQVTFSPDDMQFNGHPPKLPAGPDTTVEAAPSLFDAMQQQLGLKLEPKKVPVDTLVIDRVQKPSAN